MRKYILLIFYIFSYETILNAQTYVGGLISTNTVWSKTGSPYIVGSRVVVSNNAILTIEPGCEIRFKENTQIFINTKSRLVSNGTSSNTIIFKMDTPGDIIKMPAGYYSSLIYDYDSISLNYCSFDGFNMQGNNNYPSIVFTWGSISFTNCIFSNNIVDGYLAVGRTEAQNCNFLNNKVSMGILTAYLVKSCNFFENYGKWIVVGNSTQAYTFTNNCFVRNHSSSINFHSSNLGGSMNYNTFSSNQFIPYGGGDDSILIHSKSTGHFNNFVNNDFPYLLASNTQTSSIDWSNNYWQEISSNKIEKYLWKDPTLLQTFITFQPFLTEPDTVAPPMPPMGVTIVNKTLNGFTVKWKKSVLEDLKGYKIYYEDSSSVFPRSKSITIGKDTSYTFNNLSIGKQYYVSVTAYDLGENESWYSEEILGQTQLPITRHVPTAYPTIQSALNAAQSGDTVLVQPGTYKENIFWPNTNGITLLSNTGPSNTIIDGQNISSVLYVNKLSATLDSNTSINGFTIRNGGNTQYGGGIFLKNAHLKLINIVVENNKCSYDGAGIFSNNSNFILRSSTIQNNISLHYGGGIHVEGGIPIITNSKILSNTASGDGGGIELYSPASIVDCIISNNTASRGGGTSFCGNPSFKNVNISKNNASQGGGIFFSCGTANLQNVVIDSNVANSGGGLFIENGNFNSKGVTVTRNKAEGDGGGIYYYHSGKLTNMNICYNHANNNGGGIYVIDNANPVIDKVNIYGNSSSVNSNGVIITNSKFSIRRSNIFMNGKGVINNTNLEISVADSNWWGHSSGPYQQSQNPSGKGDSTNVYVSVIPFLSQPDTSAPPIPVVGLILTTSTASSISLTWGANPVGDLTGYKIYYDTDGSGYPYTHSVDVGNTTSYTINSLETGKIHYITITAYDINKNESWYSNEIKGIPSLPILQTLNNLSINNVRLGDSAIVSLPIISASSSPLIVYSIAHNQSVFNYHFTDSVRINGKDTFNLDIMFKPVFLGTVIDTLKIKSDGGDVFVVISGTSPFPVFNLKPNVYRKDSVAVGDSSSQVYTIKNTSINDLTYDSAKTKTLPFVIKGATTGIIKSNDSSVITLLFKPNAFGEFADTLSVTSLGKVSYMPLAGSSPYPKMVMSLSSLDFGNVRKDTSSKRSIVVKNSSINKLRIDSLKTKSSQFMVDKFTSPIFVTKKDSAIFVVTFKADTIKQYNDTLSIFSNQQHPIVFTPLAGNGTLTSVLFSDNLMPTVYELNQNFPNPFNPSTAVRYGLPNNSTVSLKVYNVLGQQVASLVNGEQSAGWQYATWNANVSTGLYFYRLEAVDVANPNNRFVQVKKMMLLK